MKKTAKQLSAILLVVVMLILSAPLSGFVGIDLPKLNIGSFISSAIDYNYMGTGNAKITDGETWYGEWSYRQANEQFYFIPQQTGYYNLNITDYEQEGFLNVNIEDDEPGLFSWQSCVSDGKYNFVYENLYMEKDHLYTVTCLYRDSDYDNCDADVAVKFEKNSYIAADITGSSALTGISNNKKLWFVVNPTVTGDYTFSLNKYTECSVFVYNMTDKKYETNFWPENVIEHTCRLQGGKEYLVLISDYYYQSGTTIKIGCVKEAVDIVNVEYDNNQNVIYPFDYMSNACLIITFSDGSKETIFTEYSKYDLYVEYNGEYLPNDDYLMASGYQPITIHYGEDEFKTEAYISSFVDYVSDIRAVKEYEEMTFDHHDGEHTYYWRINVGQNDLYSMYSYQWDDVYDYDIEFYDKDGIVEYNDKIGGWVLEGGKDYCLRFTLQMEDYYYADFDFSIEPKHSHNHAFDNGVITKAATCKATGLKTYTCKDCGVTSTETIAKAAHKFGSWTTTKAATCTATGSQERVCSVCKTKETKSIAKLAHTYKDVVTKATLSKDGKVVPTCTVCKATKAAKTVYYPKTFKLSATSYNYDGKAKKPTVTVTDSNGKTVAASNYTLSYTANTEIGTSATVKITFKGNYSGSKSIKFKIVPAQVTGLKASSVATTSLKLSWTKVNGAKYYKVEQSTDGKKWTVVNAAVSTNSLTVKSLKAGTKYQFRVTALDSTKKIAGKVSAVLKTGTKTSAPTVTLKSSKSKTVTATWKKITGASKYIVYKSTDNKKWTKVTETTKLTYDLTKLTGGKKIHVKVVAVNAYKVNSADSKVVNITVKK